MSYQDVKTRVELTEVGQGVQYLSRKKVAVVTIPEGSQITTGDLLQYGDEPDAPRLKAESIQFCHRMVSDAVGPTKVGIWVGRPVPEDVPVFRVTRTDG
ncbi:MAG: hypothetical protein HY341_01600 [Candidatus Kerfeldbacteria bacterium]|nr:hypothetical protein [Candidatus Kerfeldbacteria bacterium]